jgi:hypothetical protein
MVDSPTGFRPQLLDHFSRPVLAVTSASTAVKLEPLNENQKILAGKAGRRQGVAQGLARVR